ncbi:MAG: hypothetical protein AB8G23_24645 [Myxococcota bacterium]
MVLTLGYLAVQIRQNSAVIRASTRQAISTTQAEVGYRLAQDTELRAAALHFMELDSTVSEAEMAAHFYLRATLRLYENQYHQFADGTFDASIWVGYRNNMVQNFSSPTVAKYWQAHRSLYSTEFAAFVESDLITRDAPPPAASQVAGFGRGRMWALAGMVAFWYQPLSQQRARWRAAPLNNRSVRQHE